MRRTDRLMEESRRLMERLEGLDLTATGQPATAGPTAEPSTPEPTGFEAEPATNGFVELTVASDAMRATVTLHPPGGVGKPVDIHEVYGRLSRSGVVYGIDDEAIKEAVFRCNTERTLLTDVEVARGTEPAPEIPSRFVVREAPSHEEDPSNDENAGTEDENARAETDGTDRVDHRAPKRLPVVRAGDVLADVLPTRPGRMGSTITGRRIPFRKQSHSGERLGANVSVEGTVVRADIDGMMHHEGGELWVSPLLEVKDYVDYGTGHIDFPGDVLIRGGVRDGFNVRCTGELRCLRTLDATLVECGSLVVDGGILGKGESRVEVAGTVKTRFVENCTLSAQDSVLVTGGVVGSHITTNTYLTLGRSRSAVRSVLRARDGVTAHRIGTPSGAATEIYCGIDFEIDRKLALIRDEGLRVAEKLAETQSLAKRTPAGAEAERLAELAQTLEAARARLQRSAAELVYHLDANEEAEVRVVDTVYPGTYIELCHRPYIVREPMRHIRFRLDKSSGTVVAEKLETDNGRTIAGRHRDA